MEALFILGNHRQARLVGKGSGVTCRPNHQRWYAKMEAQSENVHIAYTFLHVWPRLVTYVRSVIINKISASELSRIFIKCELLVGFVAGPPSWW